MLAWKMPGRACHFLHIHDQLAHRLFARVLPQDADDHRRHFQRSDRLDLTLDRPHQDLARVDRPFGSVHVRIGAIDDDRLRVVDHLLRHVRVQVERHHHRHARPNYCAGARRDFAVDVWKILGDGGAHLVEQHTVPWSALAPAGAACRRRWCRMRRLVIVPDGSLTANSSGTRSKPNSSAAWK